MFDYDPFDLLKLLNLEIALNFFAEIFIWNDNVYL